MENKSSKKEKSRVSKKKRKRKSNVMHIFFHFDRVVINYFFLDEYSHKLL